MTVLRAATHASSSHCSPPSWHVVETANFRIFTCDRDTDRDTAKTCEDLRDRLVEQWLGADGAKRWQPKCDIVLHASDESYLREVGQGGRTTVASALVTRQAGRIAGRRIDVRATRPHWQTSALPHELVHVVVADRFASKRLPRWADEGIAVLADPPDKQQRHMNDLQAALDTRAEFRLHELITLANYPSAGRWGTFYGQSASLVEFLVGRSGEQPFLRFVTVSQTRGYEHALQQVYGLGVAELERQWRTHARRSMAEAKRPRGGRIDPDASSVAMNR